MNGTMPLAPQRPDRILTVAVGLVALFGAVELAAIGLYYGNRARAAYVANHPSVTTTSPPAATIAPQAPAVASPAVATAASAAPGATTQTTPSAAALSAADRLLKEATMLRDHGDTTNALARLQEAAQRDPKNANVLAEMAMIYESIQQFDRSNETWRKIQEIGPSAGALYELADMKLKMGVPAPQTAGEIAAGPGLAGVAPLDTGTRGDSDGIPEGSTFGITEVTPTENPDTDSETNMTLRIAVKARPNSVGIDHTKVKIQVFFYDTVDNKDVVLTDADVSYEWVTPQHDWKTTNPEVLAVTYVRAKNRGLSSEAALSAAAAAVQPGKKTKPKKADTPDGSRRKYLGYIVRVYYNDQLQAVRADPTKLLNLFPPPFTAPSS
ncbi:MAG: tetratricopeptide repeat protein [Chthoniobacterales bacterium]